MTTHIDASNAGVAPDDKNWLGIYRPLVILLAIFLVFYFSALSHFSLGIDDESGAVRTEASNWARQGRWLLYVIEQWFITQPTMVFFPLFFFGLCNSIAYVLLARAYRMDLADPRTYLLFVLFCAFPTIFQIANFLPNIIGLGVGLVAACAAIACFARATDMPGDLRVGHSSRIGLYGMSVLAIAIATGAYQSLLLVVFMGCVGLLLREMSVPGRMGIRGWLVSHGTLLALLVGGAILSELASHLVRSSSGLDTGLVPEWYSKGYLKPGLLVSKPLSVLGATWDEMKAIYGGSAQAYGYVYYSFPVFLLVGLAGVLHAARSLSPLRIAGVAIYAFAILLAPFALNLLSGGELPYRALGAVPLAFWLFGAFAVFSANRVVRSTGVILLVLIALQSQYTLSMLQTERRIALEHDSQLASQIYDRIGMTVPGFDRNREYPIDFFGYYEFSNIYPEVKYSTLSASFFSWDKGNIDRTLTFMRVMGYTNFRKVPDDQRGRTALAMMDMPVWPQRDSVKFLDGTILIRLGTSPSPQQQALVSRAAPDFKGPAFWTFDKAATAVRVINATVQSDAMPVLSVSEGTDVQVHFSTGLADQLRKCHVLGVRATIVAAQADVAQLFFLPSEGGHYDGANSGSADVRAAGGEVKFVLQSPSGFSDHFRLDPVKASQPSKLSNMTFTCIAGAKP